ncbi:MAG: class I SAM-dependent DNA methyltransferase [Deltaproteobacteria bacterium]|jgi:hypothetical protein|nr:class I SAM-dependent DNA methyltransferase [Deltaproteobacteria bacterium]
MPREKLTWDEMAARATGFRKEFEDASRERSDAQAFVTSLLHVFGVPNPREVGEFEHEVRVPNKSSLWMDYLWKGVLGVEMKARGRNIKQAMGQLEGYVARLQPDEAPKLLLACDFKSMFLKNSDTGDSWKFDTRELGRHLRLFSPLAGLEMSALSGEQTLADSRAAEQMARLHDSIKRHGYCGHPLEVCLVRLLFCMFAEDTGIFPENVFSEYVEASRPDGSDLAGRLGRLFEHLDTPDAERAGKDLLPSGLAHFRYIDGGLFAERIPQADFDREMRRALLDCASFDWNAISPTVFGSMFQGVMDKEKRREIGAHYTSEENILKLIGPLFLDDLRMELRRSAGDPAGLERFREKLSRLRFLDPACGCGNFLIVAYREVRKLELEAIAGHGVPVPLPLDISMYLKVLAAQFSGIEIEDFPCQIARVGIWLTDYQMNMAASERLGQHFVRIPLGDGANIVNGDALRLDWDVVAPKGLTTYVLGNPPYAGARMMRKCQKDSLNSVFEGMKGAGDLDYVTAWFRKAADYAVGSDVRSAFVATSSIVQGLQPAVLWKPLMERGVRINFGSRPFKWSNEGKGKAAVHCVIEGFSFRKTPGDLNQYLLKGTASFIWNRKRPICKAPEMLFGTQPIDNGNYIFTSSEKAEFLHKEPEAKKFFKPMVGGEEFINGGEKWFLWLVDADPGELKKMPEVMKLIDAVRKYRLASKRAGTRKMAETPTRLSIENLPESDCLALPSVSASRRKRIPIGFIKGGVVPSNHLLVVPDADVYHFGVLTSSIHMAWTEIVSGRIQYNYGYSVGIVYNNFPWPSTTRQQKTAVRDAASAILHARTTFPDSSLADLYDPLTMPKRLINAHLDLDRYVAKSYNFPYGEGDEAIVARLMKLHREIIGSEAAF